VIALVRVALQLLADAARFVALTFCPSSALRAEGVSFEDRQDLLGHRSARITTHYSAAELSKLIEAANRACEADRRLLVQSWSHAPTRFCTRYSLEWR
jgi:hypothetical protein